MNFADLRGAGFKEVFVQTGRINLQAGQTYILNKNHIVDGDYIGGGVFNFSIKQLLYKHNKNR